ncbi:hypothetical protein PAMA_007373 [Pampus argenteus]
MKTTAFIIGLIFICYKFTDGTTVGVDSPGVQWACRDRYLWIHVPSGQTPRFEAIDESGVHSISAQLASRCGYTISTFKMDGFTTLRASYYSCFTHNQVQRMASAAWQLMFLQSDGQVRAMSISEAQRWGYSLSTTSRRVVLRSQYSPQQAELMTVDGVPVEVVRVSVFFKQKLMVVMIDVSMACTVNSGSFDGQRLLWDVPRVMTPLVGEGATFESQRLSLGVEGVLLDQNTISTRGFSLVQRGSLVQIQVPFGAEGGYRKSSVVNNVYKETYVIFLLYEHVFSLLYEDGGSVDTRHRLLRVLDTPLLCRPPFSLDQTVGNEQAFRVYLGNIPADVVLEDIRINGKLPLLMSDTLGQGIDISPVVHVNGSQAYELWLPFEDTMVQSMYLGKGVVQYSIDINFTLAIMPQRESYYHHTVITARVFNTFPPEITAQCSDRGIAFRVVRQPQAESLWEVGVDQVPLTSQLAAQRGYRLHNDGHKTTVDIPVFSIGYTYKDINLSNFYGTFKLLLRDSKTLEVQTSTSKHCLFKTEDMIVCSADGTVTVVTTLTSTWPTVQPERTSLLDPSCGPKQTDKSRVLFEFKLDSCATRVMVGDSYVVYENEILHDRQLIRDGPNFISRESQFKPQPKSGPSHFITVSGGRNKLLLSSQNLQTFPNLNLTPPHKVPLQVPAQPGNLMSQMEDRHVFESQTDNPFPNFPPRYEQLPDGSNQLSHLNTPSLDLTDTREKYLAQTGDHPTLNLDYGGGIPPVVKQLGSKKVQNLERTGSTEKRNVKTIQSRVQNIKVKPLRKLVSSAKNLSQKPSIQPTDAQSSSPSFPHSPQRLGRLRQEQGIRSIKVKPDQSAAIYLTDLSPN